VPAGRAPSKTAGHEMRLMIFMIRAAATLGYHAVVFENPPPFRPHVLPLAQGHVPHAQEGGRFDGIAAPKVCA
jgi:hypothetical protein